MGSSARDSARKKSINRRFSAVERQRAALNLRKAGYTYEEIADQLGYAGASGARKAIVTALHKTIQEPSDELRKIELERLDALLTAAWDAAMRGSPRHIEMVLKVMDRRAALLGLDAPKQVEDHRIVSMQLMADSIAEETGLDAEELIAEAERIIKQAAGGG